LHALRVYEIEAEMKISNLPVDGSAEPVVEPGLPIVDAHHHLFYARKPASGAFKALPPGPWRNFLEQNTRLRYLIDEFSAEINEAGHNIVATVFLDSRTMYRPDGPEDMRSIGEVEFASGVAAMSASGMFGPTKMCAGIIGDVPRVEEGMEKVLEAQIQAGGGRYRSLHFNANYDDDPQLLKLAPPGILLDKHFRAGYKSLERLGLAFDVNLFEPQLPDLIDLARAFPGTQIIVNHTCWIPGIGGYTGRREERFPVWLKNMKELGQCPNVAVKLGGLSSYPFSGFKVFKATPRATSEAIAEEWKPTIEGCIEAFGADRCMFESDAPGHNSTCSYRVLWNAFKQIVAGASNNEKIALFSGTAARIYRLNI
jgi:L-fuconolactonase